MTEKNPIKALLDFIGRTDNAGVVEGIAVIIQFQDTSHRVWVAHHGKLDSSALQAVMTEAGQAAQAAPPFSIYP